MPLEANLGTDPESVELGIATDKVCQIIFKAQQFDAKEANSDPDSGSNGADDGMADVLEDNSSDPVQGELTQVIRGLDVDERAALVALAWVGRGTYDKSQWSEALETARAEHAMRAAEYLLGLPLLADYLAAGLEAFGESCEEFEERI
jgi:hypothetical protein